MNTSLQNFIDALQKATNEKNFTTPYASFALPFVTEFARESRELAGKFADFQHMAIVGIGGSNLGTMAVMDALSDILPLHKTLHFFDTTDASDVARGIKNLQFALNFGEKVVITVISKSGGTTETLALASTLYAELSIKYPKLVELVTISDGESKLDILSEEQWWHRLHIPKQVWGRYSVLSNVGLFPLVFAGVDIEALLLGAKNCINEFLSNPIDTLSYQIATEVYQNFPQKNILEHWFFSKKMENLGKWYRQLLAESIGKIRADGTSVGITPITAIGTTDLHSSAQLVLAHPSDRSVVVVWEVGNDDLSIASSPLISLLPHLEWKSLKQIMSAAERSFIGALQKKDAAIYTSQIDTSSAESVGYWLQSKMIEVALLAELFSVDAFDQPNVEDYKKIMEPLLRD